jgi:hypothetical protein
MRSRTHISGHSLCSLQFQDVDDFLEVDKQDCHEVKKQLDFFFQLLQLFYGVEGYDATPSIDNIICQLGCGD